MDESLTEQCRVKDEGLRVVNFFSQGGKFDVTCGISIGKPCASSRGNTGDASVIRNYWA